MNHELNKQKIQQLAMVLVLAALFYGLSHGLGSGADGTFSAQSKPAKSATFAGDVDDDDDSGWGSGTRGAKSGPSSAEARARADAQRRRGGPDGDIPVYDAGRDGGWGN